MMDEMEQLKTSIDNFFEKKDVSLESRYFLTKLMNEEYWELIVNDGQEPEPGDYDYEEEVEEGKGDEEDFEDVVEDDSPEEEDSPEEIPELELEPPRPPVPLKKSVKSLFKKPVVKTK